MTQKLGEQLDTNTPDLVSVKQEIEKIVLRACQHAWPLYDTGKKSDLQILLAIKAVDGLGFFEINGPLVRGVSEYACIGYGTDLAIYKQKHLFMPRLPLELVTPLMVHLIKTVKDNSIYCGGKTSVWVLRHDGTIDMKSDEYIERAETAYDGFDLGLSFITFALPILRDAAGRLLMDLLAQAAKDNLDKTKLYEQAHAAIVAVMNAQPKQLPSKIPEPEGGGQNKKGPTGI